VVGVGGGGVVGVGGGGVVGVVGVGGGVVVGVGGGGVVGVVGVGCVVGVAGCGAGCGRRYVSHSTGDSGSSMEGGEIMARTIDHVERVSDSFDSLSEETQCDMVSELFNRMSAQWQAEAWRRMEFRMRILTARRRNGAAAPAAVVDSPKSDPEMAETLLSGDGL
jgi:hypothetical protein